MCWFGRDHPPNLSGRRGDHLTPSCRCPPPPPPPPWCCRCPPPACPPPSTHPCRRCPPPPPPRCCCRCHPLIYTHTLDWCACALDGGKKRYEPTDGQGVSRSRMCHGRRGHCPWSNKFHAEQMLMVKWNKIASHDNNLVPHNKPAWWMWINDKLIAPCTKLCSLWRIYNVCCRLLERWCWAWAGRVSPSQLSPRLTASQWPLCIFRFPICCIFGLYFLIV